MTEAEWSTCTDPRCMLDFIREKTSERKLRLFACACCRYIWPSLLDVRSRKAVEIGERMADGLWNGPPFYPPSWKAYCDTDRAAECLAAHATTYTAATDAAEIALQTGIAKSGLFHEIFGNPFRREAIDPSWLTWNDCTVPKLARVIYEERAFDRMPILGDALEEAACASEELLAHCRGDREHARGCWVLDLLLRKE